MLGERLLKGDKSKESVGPRRRAGHDGGHVAIQLSRWALMKQDVPIININEKLI